MVTFTANSKLQVDEEFVDKVNVTVASVLKTSIVIKNVSFADEACYVCTFSVYPSGTERETACLTVQGLSEITPQIQDKPKEKNAVVSCSATGKPTPVFSWWSGGKELSDYLSETFTVQNEDGSVTSTSNLTIPYAEFSGKYVKCWAKSGSKERTANVNVEKQTDTETPVASRYYIISAVVMISCVVAACCIVILFHRKRKTQNTMNGGKGFLLLRRFYSSGLRVTYHRTLDKIELMLPPKLRPLYNHPAGFIWSRYCLVIIPKNWALFAVNFFLGLCGSIQLIRIWR
ncbi:Mitochondrial pyruvate carrier 2 [Bagarius yarrelli]|uniref:Mitochondrial pyruvate carrier n=1 Tax=Bagarius yarrelli TaxID=175774 RepID=A0A556TK98_BAGYA|nr:Mitochondrial pyruvate carrier 2 [Bagarius yarrelli]